MSSRLFFSHGAHKPHFEHPHAMHTEAHVEHRARQAHTQNLGSKHTARYQRRHSEDLSESMSDTQRKIWAIFFIFLLATNDPTSSYRPRLRSEEPKRAPQSPPSEPIRIVKPVEHSRHSPILSSLTTGLASLALGPVGGLLSFASSASANDVPHEGSHFFDPMPAGIGEWTLAKGFSALVKRYNVRAEDHHERIEAITQASLLVSSILSGAYCGIPEGPVGMLAGALTGAAVTLTADWGGQALYNLMPEQLDAFADKVVDTMGPAVHTVFPVLDGEEARIAVTGGAVLTLSMFHVHGVGKAVAKSAFIANLEEMGVHSVQHSATKKMADQLSIGTPFESIKEGYVDAFSDPLSDASRGEEKPHVPLSDLLPDFPGEPGTPFYELLHQAQKKQGESLAQSIEKTMQKEWKAARKHIEKKADQPTSDPHIEQPGNDFKETTAYYPVTIETLAYGLQGARALAHLTGNYELAWTLAKASPSFLQVIDSVRQISTRGATASAMASGAMAGASVGPWGAFIGGGLALVDALFGSDEKDNSAQIILTTIVKNHQEVMQDFRILFSQNAEFRAEVQRDLSEVKNKFGILEYYSMVSFLRIERQAEEHARDSQMLQAYYSADILRHLGLYFNTIDHKIDSLLLEKRCKATSDIDHWTNRTGKPLGAMSEEIVYSICGALEDGLRVIPQNPLTLSNSNFNGWFCKDFSATPAPGGLLGYLLRFLQSEFNLPIPVKAEALPNMKLYLHEAAHYLTLRKEIPPEYHYDEDDVMLKEVIQGGLDVITAVEWVREHESLVITKLLEKYTHATEAFRPIFLEALENEVEKRLREALSRIPPSQRIQDISKLKISLLDNVTAMISHVVDRTPLNAFAQPWLGGEDPYHYGGCTDSDSRIRSHECLPLKLSECKAYPQIPIPAENCIAERLALGRIVTYYDPCVFLRSQTTDTYNVVGNVLWPTWVERPVLREIAIHTSFVENDGTARISESNAIFPQEGPVGIPFTQELMQELWQTGDFLEPPTLKRDKIVPYLIDLERKKLIGRAVSALYDGVTPLSIRWLEALGELQASRNLLKAILIMLGISEEKIDQLDLWSENLLRRKHSKYITREFTDDEFFPPAEKDTSTTMTYDHILSLCNQIRGPEENGFLAPLIDLLGQYGNYARDHQQGILRHRKDETTQPTIQKEQTPSEEGECAFSQEVVSLKKEIKDLRSQMEEITALMRQMVLNQKKE